MIQCNAISKSYKSGFLGLSEKSALKGVSLSIEKNEVFGMVGPNGAGKSTTLKILMGFIHPNSGHAFIDSQDVKEYSCHSKIGYLPEHPSLYPHLSPMEHLLFACSLSKTSHEISIKKSLQTLELVNLSDVAYVPVKKFSKGMTQRAALAYALVSDPEILILDEPMSGLDPIGRQMVIDIILQSKKKGTTILFCSHILTDVERICDRIGIMNKGKLIHITTPKELNYDTQAHVSTGAKSPLENLFLSLVQGQTQ